MKKLLARGGPLGVFAEYPVLARLALICVCAETSWATLLIVMEFYFKEELLVGQTGQFIASKVATTFLAFVGMETIFKYPMGRLADKYGPRPFVLLSLSICSITPILMYFSAREWWHFMPLRALDGFAAAALWPAMSALMARAVPREAKAASMSVFNAAYCLGLAVGPMTGLYIGHALNTNRNVFPFCAAIMFVGLLVALFSLTKNDNDAARQAYQAHSSTRSEDKTSLLRHNKTLWRMMVLYAVSQIGTGILAPTVPIYIGVHFGIKQQDLSGILIVPALIIAAIAIPLGRLPDSIGRARAVWISYAMAASGMFLTAITGHFPPTTDLSSWQPVCFGAGMLLFVLSYILMTPAWLGLTSLQVDDSKQAQALSLMQTAQGVGVVIAFAMVAWAGYFLSQWQKAGVRVGAILNRTHHATQTVQEAVPLSVWFWLACGLFVLCLVGTFVWVKEPAHDTHQEEVAREAESVPFADQTNA